MEFLRNHKVIACSDPAQQDRSKKGQQKGGKKFSFDAHPKFTTRF